MNYGGDAIVYAVTSSELYTLHSLIDDEESDQREQPYKDNSRSTVENVWAKNKDVARTKQNEGQGCFVSK